MQAQDSAMRPIKILTNVEESRVATEWQRRTSLLPHAAAGRGLIAGGVLTVGAHRWCLTLLISF